MKIRQWRVEDVPALVKLAQESPYAWSEKAFTDCFKPHYSGWVIEKDTIIIGFVVVLVLQDELELLNISVDSNHRRQGAATKLLNHIIQFAQHSKIHSIFLEVRASNNIAQKFYKHYGFTEMNVRKNYYPTDDGREDAVILRFQI